MGDVTVAAIPIAQAPPVVAEPEPGDTRMHSVTTISGILKSEGLLYWNFQRGVELACSIAGTLKDRIEEEGEASVIKALMGRRFERLPGRISDTEFGSELHVLAEQYARTGVRPDIDEAKFMADAPAARKCLDQLDEWLQRARPEYRAVESVVWNDTYGYAGTADAFVTLDGVKCILDYKFSKESYDKRGKPRGLYPEIGLQLAGYRFCESFGLARRWEPPFSRRYYLINDDERARAIPVPEVETGVGVKITPEFATAYPVRCDDEIFDLFLACLDAARYVFDVGPTVIGAPLVFPEA